MANSIDSIMKILLQIATIVMCVVLNLSCTQIKKVDNSAQILGRTVASGDILRTSNDVFVQETRGELSLLSCDSDLVPFSKEGFERGDVSGRVAKYSKIVEVIPRSSTVRFLGVYRKTSWMHVAESIQVELLSGKFSGRRANANLVDESLLVE